MGKVTTLFEDSSKTIELYPRTKTSAVSDNDGNTLGDVAVWNALDVTSGIGTLKVGIDMDLLWENSSPATTFAGQTITNDNGTYSLYLCIHQGYASTDSEATIQYATIVRPSQTQRLYMYTKSGNKGEVRDITVNPSNIVFGDAYDTTNVNNNYLIPIYLYGIR